MSITSTRPGGLTPAGDDDPFRLGWRYLKQLRPDGSVEYIQIPLTEEGLLYPEEDDFVVTDHIHGEIMFYLAGALTARFEATPGVVVRWDGRVEWATGNVRALGPDVIVFFDVTNWRRGAGTFDLDVDGGRPVVVVEITSPSTRENDFGIKVDLYERAGVEWYIIVDRDVNGDAVRLVGYRFDGGRRLPVEPDAGGRLWVKPLGLWFGIGAGRVVVTDVPDGEPMPDYSEALRARDREKQRADDEKLRADEAVRLAEDMAARYRELEAELRRLRGENP